MKRNKAPNNMLANFLPLHTLNPWGGVKRTFFSFSESSHVAYQINGFHASKYVALYTSFSKACHVAYQIKRKEVLNIMQVKRLKLTHTLVFWVR